MEKITIVRTITLALALLNQLFAIFGVPQLDISDDTVYQLVSAIATVASAAWAWWKNNSFTKEAQSADIYMRFLKCSSKCDNVEIPKVEEETEHEE